MSERSETNRFVGRVVGAARGTRATIAPCTTRPARLRRRRRRSRWRATRADAARRGVPCAPCSRGRCANQNASTSGTTGTTRRSRSRSGGKASLYEKEKASSDVLPTRLFSRTLSVRRRFRRDDVEVRHQRLHLPLQRGERGDCLRVLIVKETRRDGRFCTVSARRPGGGGGHLDGDARDAGGGASEGALGGARRGLEASRSHASRLPNAPLSPYRTSSRISYGSCGGVCASGRARASCARARRNRRSPRTKTPFFRARLRAALVARRGVLLGARSGTAFTL